MREFANEANGIAKQEREIVDSNLSHGGIEGSKEFVLGKHLALAEQIQVVENTLKELDCADKPSMIIFNKIDNYSWIEKEEDDLTPMEKENIPLEDLKKTWMAKLNEDWLFISAKNKENIDEFREVLYKKVRELHVQKYPYNDFLYQDYE